MAMKIKNRFLISLSALTVALLASAAFLTIRSMRKLREKTLSVAVESVHSLASQNIELSKKVLTIAGERFVEMNSATAAIQLQQLLSDMDRPFNYSKLRSNPEIRAIATREIKGFERRAATAGRMDMLDLNGEAVIHSNPSVEGKNYRRWRAKFPQMWNLVKRSFTKSNVSGYYTFIDAHNRPVKKFMSLSRVRGTPFIVCAVVEIKDFFLPVNRAIKRLEDDQKKRTDASIKAASAKTLDGILQNASTAAAVLLLLGILLALWQAESLSDPIRQLAKQAKQLGDGDFTAKVAERGALETRLLARSFNNLGAALTEYVENLKKETKAREAIESEIKVARGIQEALLPSKHPPFPDIGGCEIAASLTPAKEVSGDFYDYFQLDDKTLAIVVGDVSGKGLPAAIFMAVTRTLIRNLCMNGKAIDSPAAVMRKANEYLCVDNDACMFVTTFMAYYNFDTGDFVYANAGHNPFILVNENESPEATGVLSDFPLGIVPNYEFNEKRMTISPGESILIHTDGVTEATAPDGDMFGEQRLREFIDENKNNTPNLIVNSLVAEVLRFEKGSVFDDITVLMLKRNATVENT